MTCIQSYMKGFNHCLKYFQNDWKQAKKDSYENIEKKLRFSMEKKDEKIKQLEKEIKELKNEHNNTSA